MSQALRDATRPVKHTVFLSGEAHVTVSALPLVVKGLQKSTQSISFEIMAVKGFHAAAAQEGTLRSELEM